MTAPAHQIYPTPSLSPPGDAAASGLACTAPSRAPAPIFSEIVPSVQDTDVVTESGRHSGDESRPAPFDSPSGSVGTRVPGYNASPGRSGGEEIRPTILHAISPIACQRGLS